MFWSSDRLEFQLKLPLPDTQPGEARPSLRAYALSRDGQVLAAGGRNG